MKHPQTKFHVDTRSDSPLLRSKQVKIYHSVKIYLSVECILQHSSFTLLIFYWYYSNRYWYAFASL